MAATDFKIKFDGEQHQLDATVLINSLIHTRTLIEEINRSLAPSQRVKINVRPPEKGSFLIQIELIEIAELVGELTQLITRQNIETTSYIVLSLVGLFELKKHLFGASAKSVDKTGERVKVENVKGDVFYIENPVFNLYEKNSQVQDALTQHFENLVNEPSVTAFEIQDDKGKDLFKAERNDFDALSHRGEPDKKGERIKVERAILNVARAAFENRLTWDVYHRGHKIKVKIEDADFLKQIDQGEAFAKGDVLEADLRIGQVWDDSIATYINKSYTLTHVHSHTRRGETNQSSLFGTPND